MSDAADPDPAPQTNPPNMTKPLVAQGDATTSAPPSPAPTPTKASTPASAPAATAHRPPSLVASTRPAAIDLTDDMPRSAPPGGTAMVPSRSAPLVSPRSGRMRSPPPRSTPRSPSSPTFPSSSSGIGEGTSGRARPASVLVASLSSAAAVPIKPRSNSSLTSSRPAPPSPAGSRPPSQILDAGAFSPTFHSFGVTSPGLAGSPKSPPTMRGSPSPSGAAGRDRAQSTSSSASRRIRPRSTLGTSVTSAATVAESGHLAAVTEPDGSSSDPQPSSDLAPEVSGAATPVETDTAVGGTAEPSAVATAVVVTGASAAAGGSPSFVEGLIRRVVVRDFAFSPEDERFFGLGRQRPRSNWGEGEPEPDAPQPKSTGSGFGFGGLSLGGLGLGSFGFLRRETDPETPEEGRVEDLGNAHDADGYWSDEYDDDDDDEYDDDGEEPDGLYRVAYAFEAEGMNEMAVEVGDLLDVRGRGGGGDGWVVAIRLDSGAEGLVPEGYLERAPEDAHPEEWARVRDVRAKLATVGLPGQTKDTATATDTRRLSAGAVATSTASSTSHSPGSAPP